jgi:hypothetical protein
MLIQGVTELNWKHPATMIELELHPSAHSVPVAED